MRISVFYIHLAFVYQTIAVTKQSRDARPSQRAKTSSYLTLFNSAMIIQSFTETETKDLILNDYFYTHSFINALTYT